MRLNYPRRGNSRIGYDQFLEMSKAGVRHENLQFDPVSFEIYYNHTGKFIRLREHAKRIIDEDWGIDEFFTSPLSVKILGGRLLKGITKYDATDTTVSLQDGDNIIGWEYTFASPGVAIKNFGDDVAYDSQHIRCRKWKIEVDMATSTVVISRRYWDELFPANFG